jgi:hypothetical protein
LQRKFRGNQAFCRFEFRGNQAFCRFEFRGNQAFCRFEFRGKCYEIYIISSEISEKAKEKDLLLMKLFVALHLINVITVKLMENQLFKRKIYDRLLTWKNERNGQTALLLQGARRVGKSTVVEEFARREYKSYILIDFNKVSDPIKHLFDDLMNLDFLFLQLQTLFNVVLHPGESVIVFDEVQRCPRARQAIKYLVADGRYHYIETGSLISIRQNTKDITIPSEEERVNMYPMDFEEFCWAMGDTVSFNLMRQLLEQRMWMKGTFHVRDLRVYMMVGGMPQAVNEYIKTNNLSKVDKVKREILQLYCDDFLKLDASGKLGKLFLSIPDQLNRNVSRYSINGVLGALDETQRTQLIVALEESMTVLVSYHANDPNVGMHFYRDTNRFKLFMMDTGLFVTLAFWDKDYTENIIYQKLILDKLQANMGYVYENLVAQMLTASGNKLYYYTFPKDEKHNYEIDFILSKGFKVCPIEVKSSGYKTHASLDAFCRKYSSRISQRYLICPNEFGHDQEIIYLPFNMVPLI